MDIAPVSGLPVGWSVTIRVNGSPTGFQTAKIQTTGDFVFHGASLTNSFFLIGNGEAFRIWKTSDGKLTIATIANPSKLRNVGTYVSATPAWNSGAASWRALPLNTTAGEAGLVQRSYGGGTVAVSGEYSIIGRNYNGVTVSGQSGHGYMQIVVGGETTAYDMFPLQYGQSGIKSLTHSVWLEQGQTVSVQHYENNPYVYYYPTYCVVSLDLKGR